MPTTRTTVNARTDSLETLRAEAAQRGVSLSSILAEAVDEKARALRARRRPRLGVGRSTDGRSAAELATEPIADSPR
ncbi:MAG: hypothetical protein M3331_02850 [Actinomycetota bacterium]|nr:hypothetical protein [Actinomycetota bacterium]